MLNTAVSVLAVIALLLPGFIIAELSLARGARSSRSDLELALRALSYALIIHLAFAWWTADLADRVGPPDQWHDHVAALALYSAVVLVTVPGLLGMLANVAIARVERREGPPPLWAAALGAGEARDGYDFMWQRVSDEGAWVIVELVGHSAGEPRLVGGLYGRGSAVGQTPAAHDLYLQQLCLVTEGDDGLRELSATTDPPRWRVDRGQPDRQSRDRARPSRYHLRAMTKPTLRIQEGALSARKTPTAPPAPAKVVPISQATTASMSKKDQA